MRTTLFATFVSAVLLAAGFQDPPAAPNAEIQIKPADIKWVDGPPTLPPGAKVAVLSGDPSKAGLFVMRLKVPADYKIMPHTHPADEHVTVISGSFHVARGDVFDATKSKELPAGSYCRLPGGSNHFAHFKEETVVQLNSIGPWGITYANPADDPRKDKK